MSVKKGVLLAIGVLTLTAVGFIILPPLLRDFSSSLYKATGTKKGIDFESLGPEIVRKSDAAKGE